MRKIPEKKHDQKYGKGKHMKNTWHAKNLANLKLRKI